MGEPGGTGGEPTPLPRALLKPQGAPRTETGAAADRPAKPPVTCRHVVPPPCRGPLRRGPGGGARGGAPGPPARAREK